MRTIHEMNRHPLVRTARWLAVACILWVPTSVLAQNLPPEAGPARTVKMFDLFCFSLLPDIASIAEVAAAGEFKELTGDNLRPYQPQVPADELRAWRFTDLGGEFTLAVTKSKPDDKFKGDFPEFANSINYACSLITPGQDATRDVVKEMTEIMGREPDETWNQDPLHVDFWTGQSDKLLVQLFHYSSRKNATTNLLSASAFVKNE